VERAYAAWRAFQDRVVAPLAGALLLGCTLLAILEIFRRYILGYSFEWHADAITFFILSGVYLYFSIAQRHDEHLNVAILTESLISSGPRARRAAEYVKLFAYVFTFVFLFAVAWWGIPEVEDSFKYESRTESLAFPMWPFLAVLRSWRSRRFSRPGRPSRSCAAASSTKSRARPAPPGTEAPAE
jgi:TRAP-type C4-dicarboxylate transport system permease small subunit